MESRPNPYETPDQRNMDVSENSGRLVFERSEIINREWMAYASCRGLSPDIFFSTDANKIQIARSLCSECLVKKPCLEYAIINQMEDGIWGGETERERRRIARRYRAAS